MQQYLPHQILGIQKEGKHVTCAKCFISGPVRLQRDRHVYRKLARSRHKRDEAGADPSRPGPARTLRCATWLPLPAGTAALLREARGATTGRAATRWRSAELLRGAHGALWVRGAGAALS